MATRLTTFDARAMDVPRTNAERAERLAKLGAADRLAWIPGKRSPPTIPEATLRAARMAASLPPAVIAHAINITKRRHDAGIRCFQSLMGMRSPTTPMSNLRGDMLRRAVAEFLTARAPCPKLRDDWLHVYRPWPASSLRLSMSIVLASDAVLRSPRAAAWTHMLDGETPLFPPPDKELTGVPVAHATLQSARKPIPGNPGTPANEKPPSPPRPPFVPPTREEIESEPDQEYRAWLKLVCLPPEPTAQEPTAAAVPAPAPAPAPDALTADEHALDEHGFIDPIALLLGAAPSPANKDDHHDDEEG